MSKDPTYTNATNDYPQSTPAPGYGYPSKPTDPYYGEQSGYGQQQQQQLQQWQHQQQPPGRGFTPGPGAYPYKVNRTPGKQSKALKIRLGFMLANSVIAITTCVLVSVVTRYVPFIICSVGGAVGALIYCLSAGWQSIAGGKHRFVDRADSEVWYLGSQVFVWSVLGGLNIWIIDDCPTRLNRRVRPSVTGSTLCSVTQAVIGLSFALVAILLVWMYWFVQVVRKAPHDDMGRKWKASTSKLLREWY